MGQIDSGSKSSRLLASRRYTHNTLTSAQESFTNVLDLRAEEIYTRAHLIPSSSLPHSGSSQKMAEFTKEGQTVTKYWYRHALTKSNTNNEVWFFLSPTGSNSGIGAQLIDANQQTNFISPKYTVASLATSTAADSTPGYLAAVYKSTSTDSSSLDGDDIVSTNDYQFDYKTGVLQFKSSTVDPTDSQYLYMTTYQYVGQTLKTGLEILGPFTASNITITGESDITSFASTAQSMISGSWKGELSSSLVKVAGGGVSGSSTSTGSFAYINVTSKLSGSSVSTGSFAHITATSKVSGSATATGSFGHVFVGDRLVFKDHQDSGEYISSDGTDISINVGSGGDINIPADIGVTFGNDGEKIEGDGTDLTITGNNINLTATADVVVPADVGITFGSGEKIEGNNTDLTITSGADINLTATSDVNIPSGVGVTFGDDAEKIEGDGTDLTISGNNINLTAVADVNIPSGVGLTFATGEKIESDGTDLSITVGASGDINIPANIGMTFGDDGEKIEGDGTDLTITGNIINLSPTADVAIPVNKGLLFAGTEKLESDGTDLTITVGAGGDINVGSGIGVTFGADGEKIEGDGTDLTIASSNDLHLTATTDINIPADVGLTFGNDGEKIEGDGTDLTIASSGVLTLSSTGNTIIETVTINNGDVTIPGNLTVTGDRIEAQVGSLQVADHTITVGSGSDSSALMDNAGLDFGVSGSVAFLRYRHAGTALSSSVFLEAPKLIVDTITVDGSEIDASGALTIDTGGDLSLDATGDINIPANIGLTFGDDAEKIEGDGTDLTITGNNIVLSPTADVKIPVNKGILLGDSEKIESDDTDLSITVGAGGDVNIPANIGLTFGDDGEKIEGDGTDLTIASSNELNLSATTDVVIPVDVGLHFGDGNEKIESNNTDLTINSGVDINLTATNDVNIPSGVGITFGDDGEKIEGDGTDLTISGNNINLTAVADVNIPSGVGLTFATGEKLESDGTDLSITVGASGDINIPANIGITFGDDGEKIEGDGTDLTISGNKIKLDSTMVTGSSTTTGSFAHGYFASKVGINETAPAEALEVIGNISGSGTGSFHHSLVRGYSYLFDAGGEYLLGDGTDLTITSGQDINLTATTDINIPSGVGLTFGNDGEKIEGDGTDLEIKGNNIKLTADTDVIIPSNVGLHFTDSAEKIESDGTNLTINAGADINLTAVSDVNIPSGVGLTFGDDGEKIEGDGTDLTIAGNIINLSPDADVKIPVNKGLIFGTHEKIESDDTDLTITVGSGGDINIGSGIGLTFGDDGEKIEGDGTDLTVASSNDLHLTATTDINVPSNVGLTFGNDGEKIEGDGTHLTIASSDKLKLDVATDLEIDVDGGDIKITDNGAHVADISATAISGSSVSTGSFAYVNVTSKISGSSVSTGSFGRLELAGNANIAGNITLGGNINIGDADTDDIVLGGEIKSNIIPDADATYDLGSSTKGWNDLHLGSGGVINLDGGDVTLTHSSNLVTITGGSIRVDKLEIDGANDYIDVDTDLKIIAAADVVVDPGGGELKVDGNVVPNSDSADDLGASGTAWNKLWVDDIDLNAQGSISIGGTGRIDLDADDDTSIRASADDVITFEAGAVDIAQMTATKAISGSSISTGSFGRLEVAGNTKLTGDITVGGNLTLGDAASDSVSITADLTSNLIPNTDNTYDLGSSGQQWKDLYVNGIGYIDSLGTDADPVTAYINAGEIDGAVIGGESAAAATVTTLSATGDVDLGDATSDTITATARFDSDIVPSTDSARDLGTSALQFAEAHIDTGYIDAITATTVATSGNVSGSSVSTGSFGKVLGDASAMTNVTDDGALAFSIVFGG